MWYKVKELSENGFNKSQISREIGIDRRTVGRYLNMEEDEFHNWIRQSKNLPRKLAAYADFVKDELNEHADLSAAQIEDHLKEKYADDLPEVHSKTVYNFVQMIREKYNIPKPRSDNQRDFSQLPQTPYGQEAQVDFGETSMRTVEGKRKKVYFFAIVLSRSRHKFAYFQERPFTTSDSIYAHLLAFDFFEGVPKKIIYDQDSVFIKDENLGDYKLTQEFKTFVQDQPFKVVFCRKADPQSKGKIENVVGYIKGNFLRGRLFKGIELLNEEGLAWLARTGNAKVHTTTYKTPFEEWKTEKQYLLPNKKQQFSHEQTLQSHTVRKDNTVLLRKNSYQLPLGTYKGHDSKVLYTIKEGKVFFYQSSGNNELITSHDLYIGEGEYIRNTDFRRDKSKTLPQTYAEALERLGNTDKAEFYLELIQKDKIRYYHDNLRVIAKKIIGFAQIHIDKGLDYCMECQYYNANSLYETVSYIANQAEKKSKTKVNIECSQSTKIMEKATIKAEASNINTYEKLF